MKKYLEKSVLGRGAFGKVLHVAEEEGGLERIIKQVDVSKLPQPAQASGLAEAVTLATLSHPNIAMYLTAFLEQTNDGAMMCIVTEYSDACTLADMVQQYKERQSTFSDESALGGVSQCLAGLAHAHGKQVLHRSLKTHNVLVTRLGSFKLTDFMVSPVMDHIVSKGIGQTTTPDASGPKLGSIAHLAPEVCEGKAYTAAADIWSLGVLLYTMLALQPPFSSLNQSSLMRKIVSAEPFPLQGRGAEARQLLQQLLQKKPSARPSVEDLLKVPCLDKATRPVALLPNAARPPSRAPPSLVAASPVQATRTTTVAAAASLSQPKRTFREPSALTEVASGITSHSTYQPRTGSKELGAAGLLENSGDRQQHNPRHATPPAAPHQPQHQHQHQHQHPHHHYHHHQSLTHAAVAIHQMQPQHQQQPQYQQSHLLLGPRHHSSAALTAAGGALSSQAPRVPVHDAPPGACKGSPRQREKQGELGDGVTGDSSGIAPPPNSFAFAGGEPADTLGGTAAAQHRKLVNHSEEISSMLVSIGCAIADMQHTGTAAKRPVQVDDSIVDSHSQVLNTSNAFKGSTSYDANLDQLLEDLLQR